MRRDMAGGAGISAAREMKVSESTGRPDGIAGIDLRGQAETRDSTIQGDGTNRDKSSTRSRCRLGLLLLFYGLFLASSSGTFLGNPDTVFMWGVARQLSRTGRISVAPEAVALQPGHFEHLKGRDGLYYFPKGMSYSLALAPFCWLGDVLAAVSRAPKDPLLRSPYAMLGASLAGPLFATLDVLLVFALCLRAGFRLRRATLAALGAGFGTILWADSKSGFSEPFMGLLITFQLYCLVRYSRDRAQRWLNLAGWSFGLLFLSQPAMIALAGPPLAALVVWTSWRTHRLGAARLLAAAAAFTLPIAVCAGVLAWLDLVRYGGLTHTGYRGFVPRFIPLYEGAYGLFFSSGKSLFLYSPPLIVAAVGVRPLVRRFGAVALFPLFLLLFFLGLYGSLPIWHGDGAWGPRYFTPLTGVLAVLAAGFLAPDGAPSAPRHARRRERLWIALAGLGAIVQVIGVTTNTAAYFALLINNRVVLGDPSTPAWRPLLYDPALSPVVGRARLLASRGSAELLGRSGSWTLYRADGVLTTLPLERYDRLDLWPARLTVGDARSRQLGVFVWFVLLAVSSCGALLVHAACTLVGEDQST